MKGQDFNLHLPHCVKLLMALLHGKGHGKNFRSGIQSKYIFYT